MERVRSDLKHQKCGLPYELLNLVGNERAPIICDITMLLGCRSYPYVALQTHPLSPTPAPYHPS